MKPAFHADAAVYGYMGGELFAAPVQALFDWNDQNGPASELKVKISNIDIIGTIATVRLDLENWTGSNFTDLLSLLKVDGEWKVMNKLFHTHSLLIFSDRHKCKLHYILFKNWYYFIILLRLSM